LWENKNIEDIDENIVGSENFGDENVTGK